MARSPDRPVLLGLGARTSIGASAHAAGAAYRAGVSRHRESCALSGRAHVPIIVARDALLAEEVPVERRLIEMLTDAVGQAVSSLDALSPRLAFDVVVATPEARPGIGDRVAERLTSALRDSFTDRKLNEVVVIPQGRSGGVLALEAVLTRLRSGEISACVWCGVDSYLAPRTLDAMDAVGALHTPNARWGFVPGEAAAACLLTTPEVAAKTQLAAFGTVLAVASAAEPADVGKGEVSLGRGLTDATRDVLRSLPPSEPVHRIYADLNGERERVDDVGVTMARIADRLAVLPCLKTPADRFGEVGAASAPLFASLAATAGRHRREIGSNVLLWTMGAGSLRGAVLLGIASPVGEK